MSSRYFESPEEASAALGLPLLIASSAGAAVPRTATRLSAMASPAVVGARLFHRARRPGAPNGQTLWITSPAGTLEYLGWAVAIAEHEAGAGRTAFLCDPDPGSPLAPLVAGNGLPVPKSVASLLEGIGIDQAAIWPTDMQGVRLVRAATAPRVPAGPDPPRWTLVLGWAVPEEDDGLARLARVVDLTVYAVSIRDHTIEELSAELHRMRALGLDPIGMVAMGPPLTREASPVERWESVRQAAFPAEAPAEPRSEAPVGAPVVAPAARVEAGTIPRPDATEVGFGTDAVPLVAAWTVKRRRRPLVWILPLAVMIAAAGVAFYRSGRTGRPTTDGVRPAPRETLRATVPPPAPASIPAAPPDTASIAGWMPDTSRAVTGDAGTGNAAMGDSTIGDSTVDLPIEPGVGAAVAASPASRGAPPPEAQVEPRSGAWPDTFVVHISSWQHRSHAEHEIRRVRDLGYPTHIVRVEIPGKGRWYRVVLGSFPDSFSAMIVADALREDGSVDFAQVIGSGGRGAPSRKGSR